MKYPDPKPPKLLPKKPKKPKKPKGPPIELYTESGKRVVLTKEEKQMVENRKKKVGELIENMIAPPRNENDKTCDTDISKEMEDWCNKIVKEGKKYKKTQEVFCKAYDDRIVYDPFYYLVFIPDEHLKSMLAAYNGLEGLLTEYSSSYRDLGGFLEIDEEIFKAIKTEIEERENRK